MPSTDAPGNTDWNPLEIPLLLEAVFQKYGSDFRSYAPAFLERRILGFAHAECLERVSDLQNRVLNDSACMERFLVAMPVHTTYMFRNPDFFESFRCNVLPSLRKLPFTRIWIAGCSTGEEVYSLAILLAEEELLDKSRIYATDLSEVALKQAKAGIFRLEDMRQYTRNYQQAGGKRNFSEYYTAKYGFAIFHQSLSKNMVWAQHNLVTDASFNEFHVIFCRNVLIYFGPTLRERVHHLIYDSLCDGGYLCLGSKESIHFTPHENFYEAVDEYHRIYRKTAAPDSPE